MRRRREKTNEVIESVKKVNRKELIKVLKKIKPGLASNGLIELSTHFIFDKEVVRTYNGAISISHKIKTGLQGAVKATEFYNLLDKMEDEKVLVERKGDVFVIKGKRISANMKIDPNVSCPIETPSTDSDEWKKLPSNFAKKIEMGLFSISKNMNSPELTCLWITDNTVFSCDGYRGTKQTMDSSVENDFLLPGAAAKNLKDYSFQKMINTKEWLHFMDEGNTIFSCRTYDRKYPDGIWDFFDVSGIETTFPKNFDKVVDRVSTLAVANFELDRIIHLTIANGSFICEGKGDHGEVSEKVDIAYDGPDIAIKIHPVFLVEILKYLKNVIIGDEGRILFKGKDIEHCLCLSK